MKRFFNFYTSYNQFYLGDEGNNGDTGSSDFWTEKAISDRLALEKGVIGIGIQSWGDVKGEIEVLANTPENTDYEPYDHVVEGGVNLQSGELQIIDCPNGSLELSLKIDPGKYRVRVYSSNFMSVKESDLPNGTDDDYYRIEIWKSEDLERRVLKQYN